MKLTEQDYKLINYLYHNSREPNTKIAKDCKLSREQVNYKLNKYLSEGLIKGFFPIFNYSKLGYNYLLVLFLKFDKFSNQKTFSKKLISEKHCLSHGIVYGKYDLYLNMAFKNEKEFNQYLSNLL